MAKFSPLHDRILVKRVEEASTTRGGIIIPDSAKDKPSTKATASCSASTPALRSRSMAKSSSS